AGTSSCSFDSSSRYGRGNRSAREESHCPNFIYDGPSSMKVLSAFFACFLNFDSSMFFPSCLTHFLRSCLKLITMGSNFRITFATCIFDGLLNDDPFAL